MSYRTWKVRRKSWYRVPDPGFRFPGEKEKDEG